MQQLQTENQQLREHVDRLQNDPSAIEHEAREELHYTRAGEVIYTLPPDNSNAANSNAANSDPANSDPANSDAVTTAPSKP